MAISVTTASLRGFASISRPNLRIMKILPEVDLHSRRSRPSHSTTRHATSPGNTVQSAKQTLRVCIVGGGVVGLTTALRLLQLNYGPGSSSTASTICSSLSVKSPVLVGPPVTRRPVEVTIVAAAFGADTTTAGAAGLWGPYKLSNTPEHLINCWGAETYDHLVQLAHSSLADAAGSYMVAVNRYMLGSESYGMPGAAISGW